MRKIDWQVQFAGHFRALSSGLTSGNLVLIAAHPTRHHSCGRTCCWRDLPSHNPCNIYSTAVLQGSFAHELHEVHRRQLIPFHAVATYSYKVSFLRKKYVTT